MSCRRGRRHCILSSFITLSGYGVEYSDCVQEVGRDLTQFDLFLKLAKDGVVQEATVWPQTKLGNCLVKKFQDASIAAPPKASYRIALRMP